jgi:hypothetical protein
MVGRPEDGERTCPRQSDGSKHDNALAEKDDEHHDRVVFEERGQESQAIADHPRRRPAFGEAAGRQRQQEENDVGIGAL